MGGSAPGLPHGVGPLQSLGGGSPLDLLNQVSVKQAGNACWKIRLLSACVSETQCMMILPRQLDGLWTFARTPFGAPSRQKDSN
jgi:hypothetical protein